MERESNGVFRFRCRTKTWMFRSALLGSGRYPEFLRPFACCNCVYAGQIRCLRMSSIASVVFHALTTQSLRYGTNSTPSSRFR